MVTNKILKNRVYITRKVFITLCPEGQRLLDEWICALESHADHDVIYKAMRAYFTHRNGVLTKNYSKKQFYFCTDCSPWMQEAEA
jgi:hypothetical protein